jgi:S-formylglutathione hydrolase
MNGTWTVATAAGKPVEVYEPPGATRPRFGVLHLLGGEVDSLRDRPAFTRLFDELQLVCVCPNGGDSWWVDRPCAAFDPRITPERFVLDSVLPFFRQRWNLAPRAIGVQGIGMGGQAALRLAFKYPQLFPVAAAIAPALDYYELYGQGMPLDELYDSKEQCRQDTALLHVPPYNAPPHLFFCIDPEDTLWYRGGDRLHEKLGALGIPHTLDLQTRAGGHSWNYFNRMAERAVRFVHAGLEQESRRLL